MIESGELIENQDGTSAFRPTLISTLDAFPDARQRPRPCTPRGAVGRHNAAPSVEIESTF